MRLPGKQPRPAKRRPGLLKRLLGRRAKWKPIELEDGEPGVKRGQ